MFDLVRTSLHRVITSPFGDSVLALRAPKDVARRVNRVLGEPLCSPQELERRRTGRHRLDTLRQEARAGVKRAPEKSAPAPVTVYFEKDRNPRLFGRIKETLEAQGIAFTALEVDLATKNFVMREAKCKEDDLPIVFVAATAVGGYNELVEWEVSGKLKAAVFGTTKA
jgi:hypothetical protein